MLYVNIILYISLDSLRYKRSIDGNGVIDGDGEGNAEVPRFSQHALHDQVSVERAREGHWLPGFERYPLLLFSLYFLYLVFTSFFFLPSASLFFLTAHICNRR